VYIATVSDRAALLMDGRVVDVATASGGRFGPHPTDVFDHWPEFREWAETLKPDEEGTPLDPADLGAPSPRPRQVFAIGLNYGDHAAEAKVRAPQGDKVPPTFTKYRSSLTGPVGTLELPSRSVDWEVELVVVIGKCADRVSAGDAWDHVAGLMVGQDFSERDVQRLGPVPQFSMGKSFPGFGPTGPWMVTVDEFRDPDDLALECLINGETVQKSRTSAMLVPVPQLIEQLSAVCPLFPGDLIFSGTPAGVGMAMTPETYLKPGDVVVSRIEGIGELRQSCVAGSQLV
jgi:2-keto-4-pentenoate hydratase/2-oxohepta-3-ene-1,7-dioic acid hydratase in catechol pathway